VRELDDPGRRVLEDGDLHLLRLYVPKDAHARLNVDALEPQLRNLRLVKLEACGEKKKDQHVTHIHTSTGYTYQQVTHTHTDREQHP